MTIYAGDVITIEPAPVIPSYTGENELRITAVHVFHIYTTGTTRTLTPIPGHLKPSSVSVFMVAGGARGEPGAGSERGGGGAGDVREVTVTRPNVEITMTIGLGGDATTPDGGSTIYPGPSGDIYVIGGLRGGTRYDIGDVYVGYGGLSSPSRYGGVPSSPRGGGGGGSNGQGQSAGSVFYPASGAGGPAKSNDWRTGVSEQYGRGGGGNGPNPVTVGLPGGGVPGTYGGGGCGDGFLTPVADGRRGIIIVRYLRTDVYGGTL